MSVLFSCFFLLLRRPPRSTRTDTLFPYTTLFRSVGQVEDILRSVLALALAIGFLLWGIRGQAQAENARDWRIASLLLMLLAVAKVFLLDASEIGRAHV